jgi:predicted ester cyclase
MLGMNSYLDRLFQVWTDPDRLDEMEVRLAEFYTDPVRVNGSDLSLFDLATRARALHAAFSDLRSETLQVVAENDGLAVAFVMHGRHTGAYETALGTIPPTGSDVQIRTIDLLTINDGKISTVWVNADDLGTLRQLGWRGV